VRHAQVELATGSGVTRPSEEIVVRIDELVAKLDAATLEAPFTLPATSSYAVIVDAWGRFKAFVDALGSAVAQPFAHGASGTLLCADSLVDDATFKLAFWLTHVGEAVDHSTV
jgi:hypothetical protein